MKNKFIKNEKEKLNIEKRKQHKQIKRISFTLKRAPGGQLQGLCLQQPLLLH